jgi:hypothetical protein
MPRVRRYPGTAQTASLRFSRASSGVSPRLASPSLGHSDTYTLSSSHTLAVISALFILPSQFIPPIKLLFYLLISLYNVSPVGVPDDASFFAIIFADE